MDRGMSNPGSSSRPPGPPEATAWLASWQDPGQPSAVLAGLAREFPDDLLQRLAEDADLDVRLESWAERVAASGGLPLVPDQVEALALACLLIGGAGQPSSAEAP